MKILNVSFPRIVIEPTTCPVYSRMFVPRQASIIKDAIETFYNSDNLKVTLVRTVSMFDLILMPINFYEITGTNYFISFYFTLLPAYSKSDWEKINKLFKKSLKRNQ